MMREYRACDFCHSKAANEFNVELPILLEDQREKPVKMDLCQHHIYSLFNALLLALGKDFQNEIAGRIRNQENEPGWLNFRIMLEARGFKV